MSRRKQRPVGEVLTIEQFLDEQDRLMLEKPTLQNDVMASLARMGWMTYHTWDSRNSASGFQDIVAVRGERLAFLELKRQQATLGEAQERWFNAIVLARQVEAYVVRPRDLRIGWLEETFA